MMKGVKVIEKSMTNMPSSAGVYRMIGTDDKTLYVGKARNLKKRVINYTKPERQSVRIQRMIAAVENVEIITTHTEAEALLLEVNLIKKFKPRYNILLRDDKNYPMILLRKDHDFPQIIKHRGVQKAKGEYFGPFANTQAVNRTLTILQKAFLLRNCSDSVFRMRERPCLQYFIKRCSAPCVGEISKADYAELTSQAQAFLQGKSRKIQEQLSKSMMQASDAMDFETATILRDRIKALNSIQSHQSINLDNVQAADIIAIASKDGMCCVQIFFYRTGRNYGNRTYYPAQTKDLAEAEILSSFIAQFYADKPVPRMILCNILPEQNDWLESALSQASEVQVKITSPTRGDRKTATDFAAANAVNALTLRLADSLQQQDLLEKLGDLLKIDSPQTIEVYDNSHLQGTDSVGAMIAVNADGFNKKRYRKWTIKATDKGDDYAMMAEVMTRRFKRALKDDASWELPDLIILDGGKGQLSTALEAIKALDAPVNIPIIAVSKGIDRHAGKEVIHLTDGTEIRLKLNDPLQFFIQRIRDESHRFAIGAHRKKRGGSALKSQLDDIPNVGRTRRRKLLLHFGSMAAVANAAVEDICKVEGISRKTAEKIHAFFH